MIGLAALGIGRDVYYDVDYYAASKAEGKSAVWWDRGAAPTAGLVGSVTKAALKGAFDGYLPDGTKLGKSPGLKTEKRSRLAATDLTVSLEKGLGIFRLLCDPGTRKVFKQCERDALNLVLEGIQSNTFARTGRGGRGQPISGKLIVAIISEEFNRKGEVCPHKHVLIINALLCADGKYRSFDPKFLYKAKLVFGALFRLELARLLRERLGLEIVRMKDANGKETSLIELKTFAENFRGLRDALSTRRQDILSLLKRKGQEYTAKAAAAACIESRPEKKHYSVEEVLSNTRKVAEAHLFTDVTMREMLGRASKQEANPDKAFAEIISKVVSKLVAEGAHWSEIQIRKEVYVEAQTRVLSAAFVEDRLAAALNNANGPFVAIGNAKGWDQRYTTRQTLAIEDRLSRSLDHLKQNRSHAVPEAKFKLLPERTKLNPEQQAARRYLTAESGAIACLTGYAGSGKSRLLRSAYKTWRRSGATVIGIAPTGKAALGLTESTGISSVTLGKFLGIAEFKFKGLVERTILDEAVHHARMLGRAALKKATWRFERVKLNSNTIVVVDESSLISCAEMAKLVEVVRKSGSKLVLCGDPYQLQPVAGAAPFLSIVEKFGCAHLTKIERQRDCFAQRIVKLLSGGRRRALTELARRGLVHVAESRRDAAAELVSAYANSGLKNCMDKIVLAPTNAEVAYLNKHIQKTRMEKGLLGAPSIRVNKSTKIHVNDQVVFRKNSKKIGVANGTFGTVQGTSWNGELKVRLGNGKVVRVDLGKYNAVELGYAVTSFRAQGTTFEEAFCLSGGSGASRRQMYVDGSRSRQPAQYFIGRDEAGPELTDLARTLSKDVSKSLASSLGKKEPFPQQVITQPRYGPELKF